MADLPRDVMENILSRLPIKPLGQFKSVSKSWNSLISSPRFIKSHLNRALTDPKSNNFRLFTPYYSLDFESPSSFEDVEDDSAVVNLDCPFHRSKAWVGVVGSCNGLICLLYGPDCIIVWNPAIKHKRELPNPPSCGFSDAELTYGFGYVSTTDDYKVVQIGQSASTKELSVNVFSFKESIWRTILGPGLDYAITIREMADMGRFSNNSLHWNVTRGRFDPDRHFILSLDLLEEKFGVILRPNLDDESPWFQSLLWFQSLRDLNGHLCLCDHVSDTAVIWLMKEYGIRSSWTKVAKILRDDYRCSYNVYPLCFKKSGELIVCNDFKQLVVWNLEERTSENLKTPGNWAYKMIITYIQSLVSPNDV